MSVVISDEILQATRMSASEMMQELAVVLFQKEKLTLAQASQLAAMNRLQFQHLLASRHVPIHYDVAEFEADLNTLQQELNRL
jgi:predicted HTH domain antitoxin